MITEKDCLTLEEKTVFKLRRLFESYGYRGYKMSRFEEYELYAQNKSFLQNENIITFTDLNGKLMALKPDVTLSIVKNTLSSDSVSDTRLHYNEEVFRASESDREIRRIMQVGVEHIGEIDLYSVAETLSLAKQSLDLIDKNNILDISHLGFVSALLGSVEEPLRSKLIDCVAAKNAHEIADLCDKADVDSARAEAIAKLASLYGPFEQTIAAARGLIVNDEMRAAADELQAVYDVMKSAGLGGNVNLDFSIVSDMTYYNGVIFQGYVKNSPDYVLSGGRYDRLIERMGKKGLSAVGFAVYLDFVGMYDTARGTADCDALFLYDNDTDVSQLLCSVKERADRGERVICSRDGGALTARETIDLRGKR